jgi:hypothetical protein
MKPQCPGCGSSAVAAGAFAPTRNGRRLFAPNGLRAFATFFSWPLTNFVPLESGALACLDCGLAWTRLDPRQLRRLITDKGTEETKVALGLTKPVGPPAILE